MEAIGGGARPGPVRESDDRDVPASRTAVATIGDRSVKHWTVLARRFPVAELRGDGRGLDAPRSGQKVDYTEFHIQK